MGCQCSVAERKDSQAVLGPCRRSRRAVLVRLGTLGERSCGGHLLPLPTLPALPPLTSWQSFGHPAHFAWSPTSVGLRKTASTASASGRAVATLGMDQCAIGDARYTTIAIGVLHSMLFFWWWWSDGCLCVASCKKVLRTNFQCSSQSSPITQAHPGIALWMPAS